MTNKFNMLTIHIKKRLFVLFSDNTNLVLFSTLIFLILSIKKRTLGIATLTLHQHMASIWMRWGSSFELKKSCRASWGESSNKALIWSICRSSWLREVVGRTKSFLALNDMLNIGKKTIQTIYRRVDVSLVLDGSLNCSFFMSFLIPKYPGTRRKKRVRDPNMMWSWL